MRRAAGIGVGLLAAALLGGAGSSAAFDFNKLGETLKKLDVDKVVETGKRLVDSTRMLSEEEEIALGEDLAARLLGAMPPLDDPEVQRFVNRLGLWLALQTERPNLPWRFIVADSDSVGAFATPGGNVLVTAGLLRVMRDEHELAGVLAHEIHHVVQRHHLQAIMKRARADIAKELAADVAESYIDNPGLADVLLDTGMQLYTSGLDQADEFSADAHGTVTAGAAGYDPAGLLLLLTTLDSVDSAEPRLALLVSTHPPTRERIDRLAASLGELDLEPASTLSDNERFAAVRRRLFEDS